MDSQDMTVAREMHEPSLPGVGTLPPEWSLLAALNTLELQRNRLKGEHPLWR